MQRNPEFYWTRSPDDRLDLASTPWVDEVSSEMAPVENPAPPNVMLAKTYDGTEDVKGWWSSEKLDGVRAYWDGRRIKSRAGNVFAAPKWFTAKLPRRPVDGELFMGRGKFNETSGIVRRKEPHDGWKRLTFRAFDLPTAKGPFEKRQAELKATVKRANSPYFKVAAQKKIRDRKHLEAELARVEKAGGEGLMLRKPGSAYERKRSGAMLKVKSFQDDEGKVVGYTKGKGKNTGLTGALIVEDAQGRRFRVGTGLTDSARAKPPPVGSTITFSYFERFPSGSPRHASLMRVRDEEPRAANPDKGAYQSLKRRLMR